ncbi:MAG: hypothetical protein ABII13_00045, partial [Patescibacteria group bacterium]
MTKELHNHAIQRKTRPAAYFPLITGVRCFKKMKKFKPKDSNKHYELLQMYDDTRTKEIRKMSDPCVKITDRYGRLI